MNPNDYRPGTVLKIRVPEVGEMTVFVFSTNNYGHEERALISDDGSTFYGEHDSFQVTEVLFPSSQKESQKPDFDIIKAIDDLLAAKSELGQLLNLVPQGKTRIQTVWSTVTDVVNAMSDSAKAENLTPGAVVSQAGRLYKLHKDGKWRDTIGNAVDSDWLLDSRHEVLFHGD